MLQKLPVNNFERIKGTCQFNEDLKKNKENIMKKVMKEVEIDVQYLEKFHELHNDLPFLPEIMKIEILKKLVANLHDKTEYVTDQ